MKIVKIVAVLWVLLVAIGIAQFITQSHVGALTLYFGETREVASWYETEYVTMIKIIGTSNSPNIYAFWMVLMTTILNIALVSMRGRLMIRALCLVVLNPLVFALLVGSASRGGVAYYALSSLLTYTVAIGRSSSLTFRIILTRLGAALGVLTVVFALTSRYLAALDIREIPILAKAAGSLEDPRFLFMTYSGDLLRNPEIFLLGTGFRAFYPALYAYGIDLGAHERYGWVDYELYRSGPHSIFLNALVEGGVFFLIAVLSIFIVTPVVVLRALRRAQNSNQWALLAAAFVCVPSFVVVLSLDDFSFHATVFLFVLLPFAMGSAGVVAVGLRSDSIPPGVRPGLAGCSPAGSAGKRVADKKLRRAQGETVGPHARG